MVRVLRVSPALELALAALAFYLRHVVNDLALLLSQWVSGLLRRGAERDRTDDLRLAKPALSQLSYSPKEWARAELNCRPHAYQACALTT